MQLKIGRDEDLTSKVSTYGARTLGAWPNKTEKGTDDNVMRNNFMESGRTSRSIGKLLLY